MIIGYSTKEFISSSISDDIIDLISDTVWDLSHYSTRDIIWDSIRDLLNNSVRDTIWDSINILYENR